jgi:ribosomal protein L12E/L44/L45/RPP1/RPP2
LAINAEIPTPKSIKILLSKAQMQALSLASQIPESKGSGKEKAEKTKDSKVKKEEKKEEPPSSE